MSSDAAYYRAREEEERRLAAAAAEPSIACIHLDLAAKYAALAKEADNGPTLRPGWEGMSDAQSA